jgi:hypothetical protein
MVGHSGKLGAAIKAVEAVDTCLGIVYQALRESISDLRHKMGAQFPHSRKKLHVHTFQSQQF